MFAQTPASGSFSVDDLRAAKAFYGETLGLAVSDTPMGTLDVTLAGGAVLFVYPKPDHRPADFTVLNFIVPDVEKAVDELNSRGVTTKIYGDGDIEGMPPSDEKGIVRDPETGLGGIAWFRDPAGNVIAVMQENG